MVLMEISGGVGRVQTILTTQAGLERTNSELQVDTENRTRGEVDGVVIKEMENREVDGESKVVVDGRVVEE